MQKFTIGTNVCILMVAYANAFKIEKDELNEKKKERKLRLKRTLDQ